MTHRDEFTGSRPQTRDDGNTNVLLRKIDSVLDALETISSNIVLDHSGTIVSLNDRFTAIPGWPAELKVGLSILPVMRRSGHLRIAVRIVRALRRNEQFREEIRIGVRDEEAEWFDVHVIPRHDENGGLNGAVAILLDITERKQVYEALAYHAFHDVLTGLANRRLLMDRMSQAMYRSDRLKEMFAVFFLDLDHFKQINDTHGHKVGDGVLIEVADRLRSLLRRDDTICRQGGDEFILLLPGISETGSLGRIARKIIARISEKIVVNEIECQVGVSIGIALYPVDATNPDRVIQAADRALYQAKEEGRGKFVPYARMAFGDHNFDEEAEPGEQPILPCYEPIFKTDDLSLTGIEVRFIRGKSPGSTAEEAGKEIQPSDISEERLTELYARVFASYHRWKERTARPLSLIFHLSGSDLIRSQVLSSLQKSAEKAGVASGEFSVSIRNTDPDRFPDAVAARAGLDIPGN